jgi:hypothetical protein
MTTTHPPDDTIDGLLGALKVLLRRYHELGQPPAVIAHLRCYRVLRARSGSDGEALRLLLDQALAMLTARDRLSADLLRERYKEGLKAEYVAARHGVAQATLFEWQNTAVANLAGALLALEAEERRRHVHQLQQRLPLAGTDHLVGLAAHTDAVMSLLQTPGAPCLVALTGMGGIGKTTLAAAAALGTVQADHWENVAWVMGRTSFLEHGWSPTEDPQLSVEQLLEQLFDQLLPGEPKPASFADHTALYALTEFCRRERCLIVVDNLESVSAIQRLLPTLRKLIKPSKVLIGAREKLHMEADVTEYAVPELGEEDALTLLRASAGQRLDPAEATDDALRLVYTVAGGNPQALRVVAGQLASFSLDDVLADLREIRSRHIEQLYDHIYRRAWQGLDPTERHVLLALAAIDGGGATLEYVIRLADLDERAVIDAIETLVVRNLVEQRRLGRTTRYTLHNLTRTFLYQQVVRWQSDSPPTP